MNRETELDILIRGGTLLTMSEAMEIVHDPVIGIRDGKILFVDRSGPSTSPLPAGETLDASHSIILPGLVNTHTHLPMTLFRGLADDLPLMEWLNHHIFPAEAKYVNREMVYAGSLLAMTEMILSGTTTFCDGYFYESRVAQAAVDAGVRAVTAQGFIDSPASGTGTLPDNIEIAERFIDKWRGKSELLTPALFCHSPYTCSPETLKAIKKVSREARVPYIVHLAETRDEARIIRERYGVSPVMHLEKSGVLDDATGSMKLYVDGVEVAAATTAIRPLGALDPAWSPGLSIGNTVTGQYGLVHNGWIDEVRISDSPLSPSEFLVPEPASAGLVLMGIGWMVRRRRS